MNRFILTTLMFLSANVSHAVSFTITPITPGINTPGIDFGSVKSGSSVQQPEVTIKNTGTDILQIGSIDANSVSAPFKIIDTGCANSFIQPGAQCSFMVLFSPTVAGTYTDEFNVEVVNDSINPVTLDGVGEPAANNPDIQVSFSSVNFHVVDVLDSNTTAPYTFYQRVQNQGQLELGITSINVIGDVTEINFIENCIGASPIRPGTFCELQVEFTPVTPGDKYAEISITTNDPDESPFTIPVRGTAIGEDDGVLALIEDMGPNNGDGNFDDVLDSTQNNVVTFVDSNGHYVTHQVVDGYRFKNMTALQATATATDFIIGSGIFDFTIEGVGPDEFIEVGITLPVGVIPSAYYIYGPTADNSLHHWFDFEYDGETGAYIYGDVSIAAPSGTEYTRSVLKMVLKDGGRGDTDLTVNGSISVTSAMPLKADESSGSVDFLQLLLLIFILPLARGLARVRSISRYTD